MADCFRSYTCGMCHETFTTDWSDNDALDEMKAAFGEMHAKERAVVCDDCYNKLMAPDKSYDPPDFDPNVAHRWPK